MSMLRLPPTRNLASRIITSKCCHISRDCRGEKFSTLLQIRASSQEANASGNSSTSTPAPSWQIKMLYDGDCPLCMREVNMLQKRDATQNNIAFIDIASPSYNPADHAGISYQDAMERIHAILPDGQIVTDVEVFRRLYEQVGLGWVYSITRIPAVEKAANVVYNVWAKNRMGLTGREDLEVILQQKQTCGVKGGSSSVDGKEA